MHGCILSYEREREREIRPRKYLATYSHHSWFHIPNYAYKKIKNKIRKSNAIHIAIHTGNLYKN